MIAAEIEALLALPESARVKLAAIDGPGWLIYAGAPPCMELSAFRPRSESVWCPADTFAIVLACGPIAALGSRVDGGFDATLWHIGHVGPSPAASGSTPRLAALRLLAEVSR